MTKRTLLGILFVVHGLAHSGLGMWAAARGPGWYVVPLWWIAEVGFIVGGLGVLGIPWCRRVWEPAAAVAALSSILLLQWLGNVTLALGMLLDTIVIVLGLRWGESALLPAAFSGRAAGAPTAAHPPRHRLLVLAGTAFAAYVAAVIPARAWYIRWGTSAADRLAALPGDETMPTGTYRIDHAVTIHAPADSVWPWLVQLGRDTSAAWQLRQEGDVVCATRPGRPGGLFGLQPGWRVTQVVPRRALVLEGRGAFVLVPRDSATTTLHTRTCGNGPPTLRSTMLAPARLLLVEPIQFVMERRMLLSIKAQAEHLRRNT